MRNARRVEQALLVLNVIFLAGSTWVAVTVSVLLAFLVFLALSLCLLLFIYRYDAWLVSRLSSEEEPLTTSLCKTGFVGRVRGITRFLPASPRCRFCLIPFGGVGKFLGIKPSLKNPNYCRSCFEGLPTKSFTEEVGVLFADLRGFTAWSEEHSPAEVSAMLAEFYAIAERELTRDDAFLEFIGDQVFALYPTDLPSLGAQTPEIMLKAAHRLLQRTKARDDMPGVGVGLNIGLAQVGQIAMGQGKDFTAVGDVVNTAARLQAAAGPNEILMSGDVFANLANRPSDAQEKHLALKGKSQAITAHALLV